MSQLILTAFVILASVSVQAHESREMTPTETRINGCYSKDRELYVNLRFHSQFFMQGEVVDSFEARKFLKCQIEKENSRLVKQNPQISSEEILGLFMNSISRDLSTLAQVFESIFK